MQTFSLHTIFFPIENIVKQKKQGERMHTLRRIHERKSIKPETGIFPARFLPSILGKHDNRLIMRSLQQEPIQG